MLSQIRSNRNDVRFLQKFNCCFLVEINTSVESTFVEISHEFYSSKKSGSSVRTSSLWFFNDDLSFF